MYRRADQGRDPQRVRCGPPYLNQNVTRSEGPWPDLSMKMRIYEEIEVFLITIWFTCLSCGQPTIDEIGLFLCNI